MLTSNLAAQQINVEWLKVSNRVNIKDESVIITHEGQGPFILLNCTLINDKEEVLKLYPSEANYKISFRVNDEIFNLEAFPLVFMDRNVIELKPHESTAFEVGVDVFYGTSIYKDEKTDYTNALMKALPTVKIHYYQKNLSLQSSGINNVYLKE